MRRKDRYIRKVKLLRHLSNTDKVCIFNHVEINTLNVGDKEKRKIEAVSEDNPQQIGTKLLTINNFSTWLF